MDDFNSRREKRAAKMRKRRLITLIFVALVIILALICFNSCNSTPKRDGSVARIEVEMGESTKSIAGKLEDAGIISNSRRFLRDVKISGSANALRYGIYDIEIGADNREIIALLCTGGNVKTSTSVTIPEGFSLERIIERIAQSGISSENELYKALEDEYSYSFLDCIPDESNLKYPLQGFLFPNTYEFEKDATAHEVINTLLGEFEKQLKANNIDESNLFETVIKASLIEREAKIDSERAKIAGVIENRLKKDMRLQIDATVVYAISDGMYNVDRVLYKDLENESLYNTYLYKGLPVGPICSPGAESLIAAANPENHSYYYYRTDSNKNDGSHIFTENFSEHKAAK